MNKRCSLYIVARDRPHILEAARQRFAGDETIEVLADRRRSERRQRLEPRAADRRRGERRRAAELERNIGVYPVIVTPRIAPDAPAAVASPPVASPPVASPPVAPPPEPPRVIPPEAKPAPELDRLREQIRTLKDEVAMLRGENAVLLEIINDADRQHVANRRRRLA